jgi:hypothetical protein
VRKSQAKIPAAWERRNRDQVGPLRGAGGSPARRKNRGDRGGQETDAQAEELALDPAVPPFRVLPGKAQDQLLGLAIDRRSAGPPVRSGPLACDQLPVPSKERLRPDHERAPHLSGEQPARRGQERPVLRYTGRFTCRRKTASWCRRTTISRSASATVCSLDRSRPSRRRTSRQRRDWNQRGIVPDGRAVTFSGARFEFLDPTGSLVPDADHDGLGIGQGTPAEIAYLVTHAVSQPPALGRYPSSSVTDGCSRWPFVRRR